MKKPPGPRPDEPEQGLIDLVSIDQLAKIVAKYNLSEVEIDLGGFHVRVARERGSLGQSAITSPQSAPSVTAASAPEIITGTAGELAAADLSAAIKSPMVGTAYLRPTPEAKPFVELGSVVKTGDKLMLVEAMKTFNDIVAPRAGKIIDILVTDGAPVEYGQPLMVLA